MAAAHRTGAGKDVTQESTIHVSRAEQYRLKQWGHEANSVHLDFGPFLRNSQSRNGSKGMVSQAKSRVSR